MKLNKLYPLFFVLLTPFLAISQPLVKQNVEKTANDLIKSALSNNIGFERLAHLTDYYGPRLSGSEVLENGIDWVVQEMKKDGFDKVWTQPVTVPHWVRGNESATLTAPITKNLPMASLGGSVGTPKDGITAEVLLVKSFEDLESKSAEAKGKIVLFNVPFTTYGQTVQYRVNGASAASKHGAVASVLASVASYSMQTPHTGTMSYEEGVKKIPHAALTVEDANLIERFIKRGETVTLTLKMEAKNLPDAQSRNVIAEITGSEFPEEIIVMGGHIDAWDNGHGAMDDGGGCVAAWEALRLIKETGVRPKRTIRVVLWTNEENGLRGANEYLRWVQEDEKSLDNHILAMESDAGVFDPIGFGFSGSDDAYKILSEIGELLKPADSGEVRKGGGGADIGPLMRNGVPGMGLNVDGSKYFWFHHTAVDTIDKLNIDDFNECVATMAVFAYAVADLDVRLPR
ncbi:MAG TPA: carboxypeptidase [Balneola sp.]|jgi:carboxypeptidase Q|nr:carboxypeptidase [Balneola sp.]MBF64165.1 carboxypeptidase [Balneola sp.]HBZ40187.1 carboxypeptidase [Balneola sp.]|tara:strand:- start:2510 stop:3883 length:1374 start_codon:yes stop_codon:yes gene_type:complete